MRTACGSQFKVWMVTFEICKTVLLKQVNGIFYNYTILLRIVQACNSDVYNYLSKWEFCARQDKKMKKIVKHFHQRTIVQKLVS